MNTTLEMAMRGAREALRDGNTDDGITMLDVYFAELKARVLMCARDEKFRAAANLTESAHRELANITIALRDCASAKERGTL